MKHVHLQPSETDRLEFWRIEELLKNYKEDVEEEKKRREEDEKGQSGSIGDFKSMKSEFDSIKKGMNFNSGNLPKPSFPNFKI